MTDATPPSPRPEPEPAPSGVEIDSAGQVTVGGDVAGRDVIRHTTQVGFSAAAVQRLLLTVGGLVLVTAICFFAGGLLVGATFVAVLSRPVAVLPSAAQSMQATLDGLMSLPPGTPFEASFSEVELNSYWELVLGPQVGLSPGTGAARLLDDGRLVLAGNFAALGNLRALAVVAPQVNTPGQLFRIDSVAVQAVSLGDGSLGWLPVPAGVLQPLLGTVSELAGPNVEFTGVSASASTLTVSGIGH